MSVHHLPSLAKPTAPACLPQSAAVDGNSALLAGPPADLGHGRAGTVPRHYQRVSVCLACCRRLLLSPLLLLVPPPLLLLLLNQPTPQLVPSRHPFLPAATTEAPWEPC